MQPCSDEIPRGYVASREHEMGVRKQGEDDTNQIRKVVIANFQVRDLECKFLNTITNTFLSPDNRLQNAQLRSVLLL